MDMDMPLEVTTKRVHHQHEAWQIPFEIVPIRECLRHYPVEAIKVWSPANPEVVQKLMGWAEDYVLIFTVSKER